MAKYEFQTEVNQLLQLIIHSLYSNKEIFLRELVSNASDALDKLKYLTVSDEAYKQVVFNPRIDITFEEDANKLIVRDTGIGMNDEDIRSNLGTIARSGTKLFLEQLANDEKKDSNLIGQFGVGFYSAFMVASKIEVIAKKAGESKVWKWISDGKDSYTLEEAEDTDFPLIDDVPEGSHGTCVIVHLNQEDSEFATRWRIEQIIKKYSDHIAFPIYLHYTQKDYDDKGTVKSESAHCDKINDASALWQKNKNELKEEDYINFYKSLSHDSEDPLLYLHTKAEGTQEYTTLFYVPAKAPFDMFHADYRPGVKLFVKRVFITDDEKELLPVYLRFVRGIIDSEDLPLNVSREILQQNRILSAIRNASVNRLLGEFKKLAENDKEKYGTFIAEYNRPLKEGLYSDFERKDELLELVRFKTTSSEVKEDEWTSFADYVSRMKPDQKAIYYITGADEKNLRQSPHLEAYKAKGLEVLIMSDEIDDIVIPTIGKYKDWELKAANRAGSEDELNTEEEKKTAEETEKDFKPVLEKVKKALGDRVKEVRISKRLAESPSCIVVDENDPSLQMERLMRAMGQENHAAIKPILEINANNPIVQKLKDNNDETFIADVSIVLLGQALLAEGGELKDPIDFIKRMNRLLEA
ncbi:molecular chaperone HtpG [Treponema phagedenis]|uniref:Chaperone protein HtpG n=1 Tax=Treponema phagedenis TaxID=162 RepID=A0A0B7GZ45_TREPH|nr:molecular chaperone HtpG [Treponema phagedenis]NVP23319.1 molecular chaperone HtpG [Treponema phagedenis]QEJ95535.1 molecular chaperone HtpG [Treponema phagedenis]QKS92761.1 molecular chaperone HtpG [Treponema phagedenis]QLC58172.1 molecular chaperone HtpG [Treponema phagedenis]QSI00941.1 molecular chaperone HtpG [Treponema phagedenis]